MRQNDYFTTEDMKRHGIGIWNRVREKLRSEGYRIVDGYGMFTHAVDGRHYIELTKDGNLIHTKEKPKGLNMDIAKYLGLDNGIKPLKVITGDDKEVIRQVFQHLTSLGFGDRNRGAILNPNRGPLYGVVGDTDGIIYSLQTKEAFDNLSYAEEIVFDVEVKTTVSNFRPKRKTLELFGFTVYEDDFMSALEKLAIKSAT
jgi:hypothetical protein